MQDNSKIFLMFFFINKVFGAGCPPGPCQLAGYFLLRS